jgi:hypothetical protein
MKTTVSEHNVTAYLSLQKLLHTTNDARGQVTQDDWKGLCHHVEPMGGISPDVTALSSPSGVTALSSPSGLTVTATAKVAVRETLLPVNTQSDAVLRAARIALSHSVPPTYNPPALLNHCP